MSDQSYDLLRANQKAHDKRAMWERPAVRRLAANNAEGGSSNLDDGNCTGTGNDFHHSCKSSDIRLKHEIVRVGQVLNGVGLYRFKYLWDERDYVGVMAQEVAGVVPDAVMHGADGYLRVNYARLGLTFQTWEDWLHDQPSLN